MTNLDRELIGFINIDKPVGWTSHDVVAKLRRLLQFKKIGHAGTLDPFATGVLPVAIGPATRLLRFLKKSKAYTAEVDLNFTTDTDDFTGEKLKPTDYKDDQKSFAAKLEKMQGEIEQYPPLYSAKKINGKKLYELMREGKEIDLSEIKPKLINIDKISLDSFNYPKAEITVLCSEGTYIRSIARDLGGHLTKLRRVESNGFDLESCIRFDDLEDGDLEPEDLILDIASYIDLPRAKFERKDILALQQGQSVNIDSNALLDKNIWDFRKIDNEYYVKCLGDSMELIGLAILLEKSSYFQLQPKVIL